MSKHNKNRSHDSMGRVKTRGEYLLDEVDFAADRMGEDLHESVDNMRDHGRDAVTDVKTKARNKR